MLLSQSVPGAEFRGQTNIGVVGDRWLAAWGDAAMQL